MDTAEGSIPTGELLLPAERGRRVLEKAGVVLAVIVGVLLLEFAILYVEGVLIAGMGTDFLRLPGVAGYLGMPLFCGLLATPWMLFAFVSPALRINERGIAKEMPNGDVLAPWSSLEAVQFSRNGNVLMLRVRPGAAFPGRRPVPDRASYLPYYSLGDALHRGRRRARHDAIVAAVERFAPGLHSPEPVRLRAIRDSRPGRRG